MALGADSRHKTRVFCFFLGGVRGGLSRVAHVLVQEGSPVRWSLFLAPRMANDVAKKPRDLDYHSEKETGEK